MERAWYDKHKIGCLNLSCEFHAVDEEQKSIVANTN